MNRYHYINAFVKPKILWMPGLKWKFKIHADNPDSYVYYLKEISLTDDMCYFTNGEHISKTEMVKQMVCIDE